MTLMRNMVSWLLVHLAIISRDDYVIMILLCCFDFSGRHIVPQVAVKSSCAQPAQKGRYLRTREGLKAYLDSPLFAHISVATSREGGWTADLYQKNLRSHSGGETRLRIKAVRDLTELNWTEHPVRKKSRNVLREKKEEGVTSRRCWSQRWWPSLETWFGFQSEGPVSS